ncbi:MAG: hypothetical protein IPG71_06540 [bacterium]|nr:hypothetical protein [bacterium]
MTSNAAGDGPLDVITFSRGAWLGYTPERNCPACEWNQQWPDSALFNDVTVIAGHLPDLGYPFHFSIASNINDTLSINIGLFNRSWTEEYDLTGQDPKDWFEPVVFQTFVQDSSGPKFREIGELGFEFKGWSYQLSAVTQPAQIPPANSHYSVRYYVWNLPQGRYQLCIAPTVNAPEDFHGISRGYCSKTTQPNHLRTR